MTFKLARPSNLARAVDHPLTLADVASIPDGVLVTFGVGDGRTLLLTLTPADARELCSRLGVHMGDGGPH